ncbi:MAG: DUF1223 domain-containing protein [Acidobacteria bacterium]|nr:DUF1223 domain-containing protein [Acidobacteriota bacterium]
MWVLAFLAASLLAAAPPAPVLVELFTSEGCSSCPPADELLSRLENTQPAPGVEIIALSEHVDYWNHQGWADPFSSPAFSARQQQYGSRFRKEVFTPQMVVDGGAELVGSDGRRALAAILEAARTPKARVGLSCSAADPQPKLQVRIEGIPMSGESDVFLAITESGLRSRVSSGENAGRTMPHGSVVRRLDTIGRARQPSFAAESRLAVKKSWKRGNLAAVVFVQERASRHVLGAGRITLPVCAL